MDGYSGAPIVDTVDAVRHDGDRGGDPVATDWDFGDGTTANGLGLGAPPPGRSTVVHIFEVRARPTLPRPGAASGSRCGGGSAPGPWQTLAPVVRTAVLDYPVVSSRAALVPDR